MPKDYFPKVKEAREALRDRAIEILESYLAIVAEARAAGEREVALNSLQWLIEHMPKEEGQAIIDASASKPPTGHSGTPTIAPQINIGIKLGGISDTKSLPPAPIIEVIPNE